MASVGEASIRRTTFIPSRTLPKTVCLPSNQGVLMQVMKNWEPLVSGPEGKREQNFKSFQETWLIKDKYW